MSDHHDNIPLQPAQSHLVPLKMLVIVWVVLCALAILNAVLASTDLGGAGVLVAMVIASTMAVIAGLYFMHLRYDSLFNVVVMLLTLIFITLFITFSLTDTSAYRSELIPGEAPAMVQAQQARVESTSTVTDSASPGASNR
ncbi:MAG TPA: cytochrome C oxidase subunit IV family protein [Phycisphaerae bacterium]|nr:cytochrome C oxidase subunit IV family protein [Phycisphaerae bacterium]